MSTAPGLPTTGDGKPGRSVAYSLFPSSPPGSPSTGDMKPGRSAAHYRSSSSVPGFPTTGEMKQQYPLVRSLIQKDFQKNLYGSFPILVIRNGIIIFLLCSLLALGMRDESVSSDWGLENIGNNLMFMGVFLIFLPLHFIGSLSAETLQGTFRNLSLYPVGINSITSSKLVFSILSVGSLAIITLVSILSPFLIMGVISLRLASYYCVIAALLFIAYFLMIFAGSFHANISAAESGIQNIGAYAFAAVSVSLFLTYWPVRFVFTSIFKVFDPDSTRIGEDQAHVLAGWVAHLSPFEMAFHFSRVYIIGSDVDPVYFLTIPLWLLIGVRGIRHGSRVYMDVFFRRV